MTDRTCIARTFTLAAVALGASALSAAAAAHRWQAAKRRAIATTAAAEEVEPGERHWHGGAPTTAMTHLAIQEALDGKAVEWMEHVSDEQYTNFRGN